MTARASIGRHGAERRERLCPRRSIPVWIELEALNTGAVELFERSLWRHPEIQECYAVAGNTDYLLFVSVGEIEELEKIHRNVLSRLPGVRRIKPQFLLWRVLPA